MTAPASTVLLLDFPGHRAGGRLTDLGLGPRLGLVEDDAMSRLLPSENSFAAYADAIAKRASGHEIVVAFCATAVLAEAVASRIGATLLVVIDGEAPDYASVTNELAVCRGALDGDPAPGWWQPSVLAQPTATIERLAEDLRSLAIEFLSQDGPDPSAEEVGAVVDWYLGWLRFLLVSYAGAVERRTAVVPIVEMVARDRTALFESARRVELPGVHAAILQERATADALVDVITEGLSRGRIA